MSKEETNTKSGGESNKDRWKKAIDKFKHALAKSPEERLNSARVHIGAVDNYLREIGIQEHVTKQMKHGVVQDVNYKMKRMSQQERDDTMLRFNNKSRILVTKDGRPASTQGRISKEIPNMLAFVMDKQGNLYLTEHTGTYNKLGESVTHVSLLGGIPVEMAGLIKIKDGKIQTITDSSGHYRPTYVDMYRGIAKLFSQSPEIFDREAILTIDETSYKIKDVLAHAPYAHELQKTQEERMIISDILRGIPIQNDVLPEFHQVFANGDRETAQIIMEVRSMDDINTRDQFQNTPMHYALIKKDLDIINGLVKTGASTNITNMHNKTPFNYSTFYAQGAQTIADQIISSNIEDVKTLIANNPYECSQVDMLGNTPMHYVAALKDESKILALMDAGISITTQNKEGKRPLDYIEDLSSLHYEAAVGNIESIKQMLEEGWDIHSKDKFGKTALNYAILEGHQEISKLLINHSLDEQFLSSRSSDPKTPSYEDSGIDSISSIDQTPVAAYEPVNTPNTSNTSENFSISGLKPSLLQKVDWGNLSPFLPNTKPKLQSVSPNIGKVMHPEKRRREESLDIKQNHAKRRPRDSTQVR